MSGFFRKLKQDMVFSAILQIGFGILLILFSDKFLSFICDICGGYLIGYGIYHIVRYMRGRNSQVENGYDVAQGIFGLAAGIFVFVAAQLMIELIVVLFGVIIVFESIVKLQDAFDMRKLGHQGWIVMALIAVIMAAFGIILVLRPAGIINALFTFAGIVMGINGVMNLIDIHIISSKF